MSIPGSAEPLLLAQQDTGGYQIQRSLRFNSSDSAYLSRTPASAGNRKTWTWAGWVKRSRLGSSQTIFAAVQDFNNGAVLNFTSSDQIQFFNFVGGAYSGRRITTPVYRDASAWYHILLVWDSANSTSANRIRLYVNGLEVTTFGTTGDPSSSDSIVNSTNTHYIGADVGFNNQYSNQYLADVFFIDGQALDPSSFTEVSATTGQLIPKAYTGTFGTNGFWLKFSDNSAATATTLGKDYSGNSNNWTPNNLSVTAGAGNDSLVDTPTSGSQVDTGLGGQVTGNYATLNPLAKGSDVTLANGNLDCSTSSTAGFSSVLATIGVTTGKWYWEFTAGSGTLRIGLGIATQAHNLSTWLGGDAYGWEYFNNDGSKYTNGSGGAYGAAWTTGDVIGVALDADAGTLTFYKNGATQGQAYSGLTSGPYFPAVADSGTAGILAGSFNFGQRPFAYTAPSGFKALCDTNLPAPVVAKSSDYFQTVLWTGNGASTRSITGLGFSPDFVWIKNRNQAGVYHNLFDVIRGTGKTLYSNTTDSEATNNGYGYLSSFDSNGFSLSAGGAGSDNVNVNSWTYVAWTWDAGTSTVTNTQGSITSQVRANASAGFSIVTYTGTGANASVGHGCGTAPSLIIVKCRSDGSTDWPVYHASLGASNRIYLSGTPAASAGTNWNSTSPTSSVFSVGDNPDTNGSSRTYVAYCFSPVAGYSSFGGFSANNSSDGNYIHLGFRARWIMTKQTSGGGGNWFILDTARNTYNVMNNILDANLSDAERNANIWDVTANGMKLRIALSGDFVYAAFAESPFQYARAR